MAVVRRMNDGRQKNNNAMCYGCASAAQMDKKLPVQPIHFDECIEKTKKKVHENRHHIRRAQTIATNRGEKRSLIWQ